MPDPRRHLPSVGRLLREAGREGSPLAAWAARQVLAEARGGEEVPDQTELLARLAKLLLVAGPEPVRVLNLTGVVVHTNLGRSPLSRLAARAAARAGEGYTDLEMDLGSGRRDTRLAHIHPFLDLLTGAEAHLVVNNNAAGVFLALAALAKGREVVISRGELVEIGGSFRVPEIMAASGARLVEVGTTNRTHPADYERAIGPETAAIMRVHPSNFRQTGFVTSPSLPELAALAHQRGIVLLDDLGSGSLLPLPGGEPTVAERLRGGSDLVFFSGDKLLGGPQAGLVAGRRQLVETLYHHPLYRAVRADKMVIAALRATLYQTLEEPSAIPARAMLAADPPLLRERAQDLARALQERGVAARLVPHEGRAGGGSLPEVPLAGWAVAPLSPLAPQDAQARLRLGRPAVLAVVEEDVLLLDVRTLPADEVPDAADAIAGVLAPASP